MNRKISFTEIMDQLVALENPVNIAGQRRFGIRGDQMLGISIENLRKLARGVRDHDLAAQLWASGIHDARLLASLVDDPHLVTMEQMNRWVRDFDSWDLCDQVTNNLFSNAGDVLDLLPVWAQQEEEFIRRAAFSTLAAIAWHGNQYSDPTLAAFFPLIEEYASDERNFVKKAVNWSLRNIGKKRAGLRQQAVACAQRLAESDNPTARWVGRDALREFEHKFGAEKKEIN